MVVDLPAIAIGHAAQLAAHRAGQQRPMYLPMGAAESRRDAGVPDAEPAALRTAGGLEPGAWIAAAPGVARATVVVANGNAGNRSRRGALAAAR